MKKIAVLILFIFALTSVSSCKSQKGCGLTGSVDSLHVQPEKAEAFEVSIA